MRIIDVSSAFEIEDVDGELAAVSKCACGAEFGYWEWHIGVYKNHADACPSCKRKFYFQNDVKVFEVQE